ncbi:Protein of unknown function [Bacillus cytotoxicus]|nr:Protein of unknown function [Bacillus cytotoxicus]
MLEGEINPLLTELRKIEKEIWCTFIS